MAITLEPIAYYSSSANQPYQVGRQSNEDRGETGVIEFLPGQNFEQALEDLVGIERIWIIYQFHQNQTWKPKVLPPRGSSSKISVFATRSPYRPNPIGLSAVRVEKIEGRKVFVVGADLLDQTPILDIKPYLPYADSFPESRMGWLDGIETKKQNLHFSERAQEQLEILQKLGLIHLHSFILNQLEFDPFNTDKKRLQNIHETGGTLCYRTWRIEFTATDSESIKIENIFSAYTIEELASPTDPYKDKELHRSFARIENQSGMKKSPRSKAPP